MFEILDLGGNLSGFQTGFTAPSLLHQVVNLGVENPKLTACFPQFICDGAMMLDFHQGAPVVQPGDFLVERMVL